MKRLIAAVLLLFCATSPVCAEEIAVAAASDLSFAMKEVIGEFEKQTGHHVKLSLGSSGNFFAQLQQGAPFDLYFSADIGYPKKLDEAGLTVPGSLYRYAVGRVVLWAPKGAPLVIAKGLAVLGEPTVTKVAIANAKHAPYGRAAVAAMEHAQVYVDVKDRLVLGENITQANINFNIGKYTAVVPKGKEQFADTHLARERAKNVKWRAIETLDQQLEEFELNFTKRGGKVIWAEDAAQAVAEIIKICQEKNCKTLGKSKSMVTEEIHLNKALEQNGIESVETELGEYIQQLDNEPPYHIVTPAMHKSKEDVARLFNQKLGTPVNYTPEQLTLKAREVLK